MARRIESHPSTGYLLERQRGSKHPVSSFPDIKLLPVAQIDGETMCVDLVLPIFLLRERSHSP